MDAQSVIRLREEIVKFSNWLAKPACTSKYFVTEYETPSSEYVESAKRT
jgi:mortality factor 4-like protein 1